MGSAASLRALADEIGKGYLPISEWGPVCAGCGVDEFRIDGYCSIECRDWHDQQEYAALARWAADAGEYIDIVGAYLSSESDPSPAVAQSEDLLARLDEIAPS